MRHGLAFLAADDYAGEWATASGSFSNEPPPPWVISFLMRSRAPSTLELWTSYGTCHS